MKWNMLVGSLLLGVSLSTPSFGGGLLDRMLGLGGCGCDSACCDTGCAAAPSCGCEVNACDPCCGPGKGGLLSRLRGPSCGCEVNACDPCGSAAPSCGCEMSNCGKGCGLFSRLRGPSCGCEVNACDPCCNAAPSCGCEVACGSCCQPRRRPLLELVGRIEANKRALIHRLMHRGNCCDSGCGAAPSCGCEIAASCDPCCDSGCGPRSGLLSRLFHRRSACCDTGCCDSFSSCSSCSSCNGSAPAAHGDAAPAPPAPVVDPSAYQNNNRRVVQATSYVR